MIYDSTPLWFSTGRLSFSGDCRRLLYTTEWNDHLRVELTTGAVTRLP